MVLDASSSVTVDDCARCLLILGPCRGSVFVRDCLDCAVFAACQQFRARDSTLQVHLFCSTKPIVEDCEAAFCPLFLRYPFVEESLMEAAIPPFTNHWGLVHDFTPETSRVRVSESVAELSAGFAPQGLDWPAALKAERVSLTEDESFFFYSPSRRRFDAQSVSGPGGSRRRRRSRRSSSSTSARTRAPSS